MRIICVTLISLYSITKWYRYIREQRIYQTYTAMYIYYVASILLDKLDDVNGDVIKLLIFMSHLGEFKDLALPTKTGE